MATPQLIAQPRKDQDYGKNACHRLRVTGRMPGILYGLKKDSVSLSFDIHELGLVLRRGGQSSIITLKTEGNGGEETPCVIREVLRDPVSEVLLHVDLMRIDLTAETNFSVEVVGRGTPKGVREGGVLETANRHIEIRCLPTVLPHLIEVDITYIEFGQSVHASEIQLPEGVKLHCDPQTVLFSVMAARQMKEEETTAAAAEAVAEPEVVGKKKAEEEAEEEKK
ncbi:MAG: 50S ribosomal protein L25 [Candidatus Sumerlaeota bacterium]|nr:50S ribosomal protein L25 [Candidatus Sumerlaeota bacterium]